MTTANERFAISATGLRELHADRSPASHVAELIQNAFDEETTYCEVLITPGAVRGTTSIVVTDDGPGFQDITHAWTLMAPTPKRGQPDKRGRFNLGRKDADLGGPLREHRNRWQHHHLPRDRWPRSETQPAHRRHRRYGDHALEPSASRSAGNGIALLHPAERLPADRKQPGSPPHRTSRQPRDNPADGAPKRPGTADDKHHQAHNPGNPPAPARHRLALRDGYPGAGKSTAPGTSTCSRRYRCRPTGTR